MTNRSILKNVSHVEVGEGRESLLEYLDNVLRQCTCQAWASPTYNGAGDLIKVQIAHEEGCRRLQGMGESE